MHLITIFILYNQYTLLVNNESCEGQPAASECKSAVGGDRNGVEQNEQFEIAEGETERHEV